MLEQWEFSKVTLRDRARRWGCQLATWWTFKLLASTFNHSNAKKLADFLRPPWASPTLLGRLLPATPEAHGEAGWKRHPRLLLVLGKDLNFFKFMGKKMILSLLDKWWEQHF